ncbi:MAG: hypothetical protein WC996_03270 [Peptostreptococcales bacterium]|jgi:hypothetical protein
MSIEDITPFTYFYKNTKLFIKFIGANYRKDEDTIQNIYLDTLKLYDQYMDEYFNELEKSHKRKEIILELIELISMYDEEEELTINGIELFRGIRIKGKVVRQQYVEIWLKNKNLWVYIFENKPIKEGLFIWDVNKPSVLKEEEIYYALIEKIHELNNSKRN